jgi:hypothetical protein
VLHESDIVHQLVYPRAYFDPHVLWGDAPSRRGENAIFNNRAYFQHLLTMARAAGIEVWLNVKEIGFSDEVLALRPEVVKDGVVCPSEPFWDEYLDRKTDELFGDFPLLAGLIVSFGSQESRASRAQNKCHCELCLREPLERWYERMIGALHAPILRHRKRLAVRDFAYKPSDHAPLIAAMSRAPADVIFCVKAMPHDFYLPFPDNPAIGALARCQWIEYDVLGQFFGWGIMPCLVLADLTRRMAFWRAHNARGVLLRIEWERINDLDAFDNLAEINLIGGASLARGDPATASDVVRQWLTAKQLAPEASQWLADILAATAPIVCGTAYMNDFVSADNSMLPRSVARAWWGMEVRDSLTVWDPSRVPDLDLDEQRVSAYLNEKQTALQEARALVARVRRGVPGLDAAVRCRTEAAFQWFEMWVDGHARAAAVILYSRWLDKSNVRPASEQLAAFAEALASLTHYADALEVIVADPGIAHTVKMLVDPQRARDVVAEGAAVWKRLSERAATQGA